MFQLLSEIGLTQAISPTANHSSVASSVIRLSSVTLVYRA